MAAWFYLFSTVILNAVFIWFAVQLYRRYTDALAKKTFNFSILYLALLFAALLIDHYAPLVVTF
jgi:protoheme IX farnesyltransferase